MTSDLRRQLILSAAKRCFARNGFAGTTIARRTAGTRRIMVCLLRYMADMLRPDARGIKRLESPNDNR